MSSQSVQMLTVKEVAKKVGISRSTIFDWLNPTSPRYDVTFPKQVRLSEGGNSVRWYLHEIEEWLKARPRKATPTIL
ncbi:MULTISPECIES: helix-turn-helix transcriptional regulator [Enterobacterales]|uniref:helix-turn-helix transcriptional regulator n=1 Tax=Enterobacterales TaxID=91347 RepID=UPI002EDAD22D